jgi:predicted ATP-grasp superfamily ATP-dependent carboligase
VSVELDERADPTTAVIAAGPATASATAAFSSAMPARRDRGRSDAVDVLLTGGEHSGVLATARSLAWAGHRPWVAVDRPKTYAARSRFVAGVVEVPVPTKEEDAFVFRLREFAAELPAAAVLPGTEAALLAISDRRDWFPDDVVLGMSSVEAVARATDKTLLSSLAGPAGLSSPETVVASAEEVESTTDAVGLPVVVKPLASEMRGEDGRLVHPPVRIAQSREELRAALEALPGSAGIVQRYLDGRLWSVGGVSWNGELLAAVHSVAERIWPSDCGLIASAVTVARDTELDRGIAVLLREVGWDGLFQMDFIESAGRKYVIDLNPRIYASIAQATAAGANLPALWLDVLLGRDHGPLGDYRVGVRFRREDRDARALVAQMKNGQVLAGLRGLLPRRHTAYAVLSWRDPKPFLTTVEKAVGRAAVPG